MERHELRGDGITVIRIVSRPHWFIVVCGTSTIMALAFICSILVRLVAQ